jgi:AcrR family transcriptional regulator
MKFKEGAMDGYQQRTEEIKQRIVQAALDLFQKYGVTSINIRDIAKQAEVSHVTIYKHFRSRNEIVRRIIKTQALTVLDDIKEKMSSSISLEEKFRYLLFQRARVAAVAKGNNFYRIIGTDPDLKEFFTSVWQKSMAQIESDLLEQGIKAGYVNARVSQKSLHLYLSILREGLQSDASLSTILQLDDQTVRDLHYLFLYGIMVKHDGPDITRP